MFRKSFSKALFLQLNKSACHAIKPRTSFTTSRVNIHRIITCQNYNQYGIRTFATIPSSAVIKQASTENGIDLSERAVKVNDYNVFFCFFFVCINNLDLAIKIYSKKR